MTNACWTLPVVIKSAPTQREVITALVTRDTPLLATAHAWVGHHGYQYLVISTWNKYNTSGMFLRMLCKVILTRYKWCYLTKSKKPGTPEETKYQLLLLPKDTICKSTIIRQCLKLDFLKNNFHIVSNPSLLSHNVIKKKRESVLQFWFRAPMKVRRSKVLGLQISPFSDVDECQTNNGGCQQICTNNPSSYRWVRQKRIMLLCKEFRLTPEYFAENLRLT